MNKAKILIVDDNEKFLDVLNEFLLANDFDVACSINGEDAKNKFVEFKPALVVTDIVMPDVDGIELLLSLRDINPDVRVIVMSGGNRGHADTYLQMADKLGASAILNKPFELSDLLVQIKKLETAA